MLAMKLQKNQNSDHFYEQIEHKTKVVNSVTIC